MKVFDLYDYSFFSACIVKTLLINGANANIQDDNELITPFFCANEKVIKVFFNYAIDLDFNKRNLEGNTPFE